jgi:hypothetical protein
MNDETQEAHAGSGATLNRLLHENIIEIIAAVILSLATVASAWSAYQATRWSGVQSIHFGEANSLRSESVRASNVAGQQATIDVTVFTQWANAVASGNQRLAKFFAARFRKEFRPAFKAWLALPRVKGSKIPPGTPFSLPQYKLAEDVKSQTLAAQATHSFNAAKDANQTGDDFVLTAVLFASVLFFSGISTKFTSLPIRAVLIGLAVATFIAGASVMFSLPQNVGF